MQNAECRMRTLRSGTAFLASVLAVSFAVPVAAQVSMLAAAKGNDREAVRRLVAQKPAEVNAAEGDGTTALHWASYHDDVEMAGMLLAAGAKVNAANDLGATPLWIASQNGSPAMVRRLLRGGASANAALLLRETPLMVASRGGSADVVEQLLEAGANVNARAARGQTALMWAAAQRHPQVVRLLLAHGADVQARSETWNQVEAVSPHGNLEYNRAIPYGRDTALMFAARSGDLESARLLVAAGANVNDTDAWGVSATVLAAHAGFPELVEYFLEKGANPNAADAGFAALHVAIMRRDERMVSALLARGADPQLPLKAWTPTRRQSKDYNFEPELVGATPLWLAARFTQPRVMRLLMDRGADLKFVHKSERIVDGRGGNAYDRRYESITTLMAAVGMGGGIAWFTPERAEREALSLEAVKMALDAGVDVNAENTDGRRALDQAKAQKLEKLSAFLEANGAKPGVKEEKK
jgi:ankyrin repeat protein